MGGRLTRALILIDIQEGFDDPAWGARNNPQAEANAAALLSLWRAAGAPVFHVRHLSRVPGSPLNPEGGHVGHKPEVAPAPGEPVIDKHVNSAFIGTDLEKRLEKAEASTLVIAGLTTPHCVSTTARMAANMGFDVIIAHDACATFAGNGDAAWRGGGPVDPEALHIAALDQLHGEFATVLPAAEITP
ncbi:cysteine hydrolase family protein [Maritimibacter sp. UBA3975]|uniref:cysteine hydrolase family protein n=1 Tax=Maritimibacter sp. UBA3975 TaxID=1946833 RepID=UPI000C09B0FA|nr:cysteine hydrolase family protein [Maritimibacter sp. UBA3975]MAM62819.1 cysteine hydrolase [Maritimibacter sp.]|tara:strand:- start:3198 stop:3761 length:564 start_codon:yes stop_codon:yes gene_type:complete